MKKQKKANFSFDGFLDFITNLIPEKMNKNVALIGVLSVLLLVVGVIALSFKPGENVQDTADVANISNEEGAIEVATAQTMDATLTVAQGIVEYKVDGAWEPATVGLSILPGMSLKTTGAASRAALELGDSSVIRIDASTEAMFETLTETRVVIVHATGYLYNRVTSSSDRTYVVQTKNAQFQSVGTAFRTSASGDEESVEVFHSSVKETTGNLEAVAGEKLVVKSFVDSSKDSQIEKLNIQSIKEDLFITWNREEDQKNEVFKTQLGFLSDFEGPRITITNPAEGSALEVDSKDTEGKITITGTTEKSAELTVRSKSQAGSSAVQVAVDDSGAFTTSELTAPLGTSVFEFVATDRAGNKTFSNVSYIFNKKTTTQEQGIALTIDDSDPELPVFKWGLVGMTTPDGAQIVYDKSKNPKYPGDSSILVKNGTTRVIDASKLSKDTTYYFVVCRFDDDQNKCDTYSNELSFTTEP